MGPCLACGADNAETAKFCSSCGSPLARQCPACGSPASGRFCSECGTPLTAAAGRAVSPGLDSGSRMPLAERRITSVLFADLVGFTTLSEAKDAEDVRELLSRYFARARTVIERYGGTVEKFIGDAVMAVWGVPSAHEDDAERAVRAGLDLVDSVASLGEDVGATGLAMRVGVVTGEVAVTVGATGEGMVAGDAVNTASRVQAAARPGQVWVDEQTRALTAAAVGYDDEGEHELKGKAEPVRLFAARQVLSTVGGARRVDGLEAPFSGRDRELRLVKELFHATLEEGRPRLVAVFGAAGVGKSRLGWEFDKYMDGINAVVMGHSGRCLSYGEGVAFWALAEILRGRLLVLEGDPNEVVVERLRDGLERYVPDPDDRGWLLPRVATLLGVAELVAPGATFARDDLFAAWRTFLERVATSDDAAGAVLRLDDLQWADAGLLDFIEHVLDTAQTPIFILALARSELTERMPSFGTGRRATAIHLEPLPAPAMASLVDGLVGGLPGDLRDALVERSEGIPLFAVETVRALIDRDAVIPREGRYVLAPDAAARTDLSDLSLPTSLHTLIASRLDALPSDERRLVQHASVLGLSFSRAGLEALTAAIGDHIEVERALAALVRKEIFAIESDPRSPERGQYRFVQALVRTVAYDTLARRDRKDRHLAAARHLAAEPDADSIPAVLASHYLDAHAAAQHDDDADELAGLAVDLLERAAARARELGAPAEARRHLETALGLVSEPAAVGRLTQATADAARANGAIDDAVELARTAQQVFLADGREIEAAGALALWGDAMIASASGEAALTPLAEAYERLSDRPEAQAVAAELALGVARAHYLSRGDSAGALPWFDRAVVLGEAQEDLPLLAATFASYAGALVFLGRPRMGLGLLKTSLELSRQLDDPHMQLRPLNNLVSFLAARDVDEARRFADEGLAIVRRLGDRDFGLWLSTSAMHAFWNAGDWDRALELYEEMDVPAHHGSVVPIVSSYFFAIQTAQGLPARFPESAAAPSGQRTDVVLDAVREQLEAARARAAGDQAAAARASLSAARVYASTTGIDDDFPIFWVTALDDQVAVPDRKGLHETIEMVSTAPRGHVTPLLRALLPHALALEGELVGDDDDTVDANFCAAEEALRRFGAPYYLARALLDHGRWLRRRRRDDIAQPLLAQAEELFARLGAQPWVDEARRLMAGAGSMPPESVHT